MGKSSKNIIKKYSNFSDENAIFLFLGLDEGVSSYSFLMRISIIFKT
jgi:hypothetical protein